MKRFLLMIIMLIGFVQIYAQPSMMYFDELDSKIQIGIGYSFNKHCNMLGIVQKSKKNFESFTIKTYDENFVFNVDTVIHYTDELKGYHECDYTLNQMELEHFLHTLAMSDKVWINGNEYSAFTVHQILQRLRFDNTTPIRFLHTGRHNRFMLYRPPFFNKGRF